MYSPNNTGIMKSRMVRWEGYVAWMGCNISACKVLAGTHEEMKPQGRASSKWVDNIVTCPGFRDE
jgi:hypothetical protein